MYHVDVKVVFDIFTGNFHLKSIVNILSHPCNYDYNQRHNIRSIND